MTRDKSVALYNRAVAFMNSPWALVLLALWGFSEASFWFVAPDFILIAYGNLKPNSKLKFTLMAIGASLIGGVCYFVANLFAFQPLEAILFKTPYVTPYLLNLVHAIYAEHGYTGALRQAFLAAPFKIWTHIAVEQGFNPWIYFPLVMISRFARLYPLTWISSWASKYTNSFVRNYFILAVLLYTFIYFGFLWLVAK